MYSWKDKLIDWANQKGAWTHILVAVGITMLILAIILGAAMPSKGVVETNKVDIGEVKTTMAQVADGLTKKASQNELDDLSETVTDALDEQAVDISGLGTRMGSAETKLNAAREDITTIQGDLAELACTPPEGYLTGAFGNYTLHAKSNDAGNFTAVMHLAYTDMLPEFYDGYNWTVNGTAPNYVPTFGFNGTTWGINEIWWNVSTFELVAKVEKVIDITCAGLNSTWEPDYAYIEVWPVSQ